MSPSNPQGVPSQVSTAKSVGSFASRAAMLALVGGLGFADSAKAAGTPTLGTLTEVANVNTSTADQRSLVSLPNGDAFVEETSTGGDSTIMFLESSSTTPIEICGDDSFGTSTFTSATSIDLASATSLYAFVPGGSLAGMDVHQKLTDDSGSSADYSSCAQTAVTLSTSPSGYVIGYDYSTGAVDFPTWNSTTSTNDIDVDGHTDITSSSELDSPARCLGTTYEFYMVGVDSSAEIWVRDLTDTTSDTTLLTGGYGFPKCNGTTLNVSHHDGSTWNLYGGTLSFPTESVDTDLDGYYTSNEDPSLVDCNDDNAAVYPGAPEDYTDGEDTDCDSRADTPEITSIEVNGTEVADGAIIYAPVGVPITFNAAGEDEETLSEELSVAYDLSGDIGSFSAPYQLSGAAGETLTFTPSEQGSITVLLTLTDSDANEHTLEFTIVAGTSTDELGVGDEIIEGEIVVDGDGATTAESDGVSWNGNGFNLVNGMITYTGSPDSTYSGVNDDGQIVATIELDSTANGGWLVAGTSSRPSYMNGAPPPNEGTYGLNSDNDELENQLFVGTADGFHYWGEHTNSETGELELDGYRAPTTALTEEVLSDALDEDETPDEPVDTGEVPDDTDNPDDTDEPDKDAQNNDNQNNGNGDGPGGCSTTGGSNPDDSTPSGFLLAGLAGLAVVRRRFFTSKDEAA
jgi:MYXO-CTERM domain-containing protein